MSTVNEGRHLWERLIVAPLRVAVSLRLRSASRRLTYWHCSWTKWMRGRSRGHYIRFFARPGTDSDCGNRNVRLENEMKRRNEKLTNAVNIPRKQPTCGTRRAERRSKRRQAEETSVGTVALGRRGSASSAKAPCIMMTVVRVS